MISDAKILVIRFSSIGDIVLTSPVVRCLKEQTKNCRIHFLCKEQYRSLVENNPYIDEVMTIRSNVSEIRDRVKAEQYDYIIDLHNNIRSRQVKSAAGTKAFTLNKKNIAKWLLVNTGVDLLPQVHVVDRYMDTVRDLDIQNDQKGLDFFYPNGFTQEIIPERPFIAVAIGGQHEGKKLPLGKWQALISQISDHVVLIGGKEDVEISTQISGEHVTDLCGKTSLFGSAKILEESQLVISNDTGMMHIASAFKKPIISLWGQTTPRFGMFPYLPHDASVIIEPESKRRLSKLGNRKTRVHVMESISVPRILREIERIKKG